MMLWLNFLLCAIFVVGGGLYIGRISGELGERLHLGKAWAGAVLLSLATTLPELVATLTVTLRGDTGLAVGGILGSVLFNLFILVMIDLVDPESFYCQLSVSHLLTGILGCVLLAIVIFGLSLSQANGMNIDKNFVSVSSVAIVVIYVIGQIVLFQTAKSGNKEPEIKIATEFDNFSTFQIVALYAVIALIIIVAAYQLGITAEKLGIAYNLSATFAGATLIGIVTSLPEITNGFACARQKEYDLAMGNILGANAFVIVVLAIADFVYVKGPIFSSLSPPDTTSSIIMASMAIIMQGIVLGALAGRSAHKLWRIGVASLILLILYIISLYIAYRFSSVR